MFCWIPVWLIIDVFTEPVRIGCNKINQKFNKNHINYNNKIANTQPFIKNADIVCTIYTDTKKKPNQTLSIDFKVILTADIWWAGVNLRLLLL